MQHKDIWPVDLKTMFPRASKSFIEANDPQPLLNRPSERDVQPIVERKRGKRGVMNKTELAFSRILDDGKQSGEIRDYLFHPLSLPWGMNNGEAMYYTPDFMVTRDAGREKRLLIEVKGPHIHYRQQAIARFKGCRSYWPEFDFQMWQLKKGQGWIRLH